MPYLVKKVTGGYKVGLASGGTLSNGRKYLSDRPLTKAQAEKQKKAVEVAEQKAKKKTTGKSKPKKNKQIPVKKY